MKKLSKLTVGLLAAAGLISQSQANTITPGLAAFTPGVSATYVANLTSGELHAGDGFTIYDVGGWTGVAIAPAGWVFSGASAFGSIFIPPASPGLTTADTGDANLHFTYVGAAIENPFGVAVPFAPFLIGTTSKTLVTDDWKSADHTLGVIGPIDGSPIGVGGTLSVPGHVPDGGTTMLLLGGALAGIGALRRRLSV